MQIYVCVKYVPDTAANIKVVGRAGFDESVKFVINPFDEYAVEQAVQIKEKRGEGEVVIVTIGKEFAIKMIRSVLALGADRGILVKTDTQFLDSILTSQALKKAIELDGFPDLIFTGKQSIESEGMQTHFRLAAAFDMPVATDVVNFSMSDEKVIVEREIGDGTREVIEMTRPCIVGVTKGLNEPRYPKLPEIMRAKKKEVKQIDIAELGLETPVSAMELMELQSVPERGKAKMLQGDPRQMTEQLVQLLKNEAKVLL